MSKKVIFSPEGDNLKRAYCYRCQICGQFIRENYGTRFIAAHYIDYFTKSMNNDVSNIMIVCPNHHGTMHERNPRLNRKRFTYKYPNGFEEELMINIHL